MRSALSKKCLESWAERHPLHLNPGGVDYEDFIQQSMSLDFTFNNLRKKVMKMFFRWCSEALLISTLCPFFFSPIFFPLLLLPPTSPLHSLLPPRFPSLFSSPPSLLCPLPFPQHKQVCSQKAIFLMYVLSIPYTRKCLFIVWCFIYYHYQREVLDQFSSAQPSPS